VAVSHTGRGIEELGKRRGGEQATLGWLAAWLQAYAGQPVAFYCATCIYVSDFFASP
jgi:Family of unknown function (DUF6104)